MNHDACPCGSALRYEQCCKRFIEQNEFPTTPTELMRSRYTAYVLKKLDYITSTMKGKAMQHFQESGGISESGGVQWTKLMVLREKLKTKTHAYVTFEASYLANGIEKKICEKSEFKKINDRWYYIDGKFLKPRES